MTEPTERDRELLSAILKDLADPVASNWIKRNAIILKHIAAAREEGRREAIEAIFDRQREWSLKTFGPGDRARGVVAHIRKELAEIEAEPASLEEWIDVAILAFDGAWRAGYSSAQIAAAWTGKQAKNELREWPDWRGADPEGPIEHIRSL